MLVDWHCHWGVVGQGMRWMIPMWGRVVGCRIIFSVLYIGSVVTEGNVKWDALSDGIFGVGDIFLGIPCL